MAEESRDDGGGREVERRRWRSHETRLAHRRVGDALGRVWLVATALDAVTSSSTFFGQLIIRLTALVTTTPIVAHHQSKTYYYKDVDPRSLSSPFMLHEAGGKQHSHD